MSSFEKGEYDKAIKAFADAIELDSKDVEAINFKHDVIEAKKKQEKREKIRQDILEVDKYKDREKRYDRKLWFLQLLKIIIILLFGFISIIICGSIGCSIYESLSANGTDLLEYIPIDCTMKFPDAENYIKLFQYLPITFVITIMLSSLLIIIRMLNIEIDKTLALREDAYTKGILALLTNSGPVNDIEFRKKMIEKFFEYNSYDSTSNMIANWHKKDYNQDTAKLINNLDISKIKPNS